MSTEIYDNLKALDEILDEANRKVERVSDSAQAAGSVDYEKEK